MSAFEEKLSMLTDPTLVSNLLTLENGRRVKSVCEDGSMAGAGGLSGEMRKLKYLLEDGTTLTVVKKTTFETTIGRSIALGLAREGLFYDKFAPQILSVCPNILPRVYHSSGDMATGQKLILLEDLSELNAVQAGYFFGPGSPHNWGKDLDQITAPYKSNAVNVTRAAFKIASKIHGMYWKDNTLLTPDNSWLRGSAWMQGTGETPFLEAQKQGSDMWAKTVQAIDDGTTAIKWDPLVLECMNSSFKKVSWSAFQERVRTMQWTLVHSDFHPANCMWVPTSSDDTSGGHLVLLDWEVVGLGSGPQDLSQFLISHMDPSLRRSCEEDLVREYYNDLCAHEAVSASFTWECCWAEYVAGGCERRIPPSNTPR